MNCFSTINHNYDNLTSSEKKIADYILTKHEDVINYSAQERAKSQKVDNDNNIDTIIQADDSIPNVVEKVRNKSIDTITDTISSRLSQLLVLDIVFLGIDKDNFILTGYAQAGTDGGFPSESDEVAFSFLFVNKMFKFMWKNVG